MRSGDAWTTCGLGHRHWGRYGAAGLLLRTRDDRVLLQLRAGWSHHGGTWGLPGGARDRDETAVATALREAGEEIDLRHADPRPEAAYVDDHGGWSYTTVLASTPDAVEVAPAGGETDEARWVTADDVATLDLHPGFAATWPVVRTMRPAPVLVVDAANTIGSRPDGWWNDRAGAVTRLRDALAARPLDLGDGPSYPQVVLVTEGRTRGVAGVPGVETAPAEGSGDDEVVRQVRRYADGPRPVVVVTADRELRERVAAVGATTLGPRSLLDRLG